MKEFLPWTDEEDAYLIQNHDGEESRIELAASLSKACGIYRGKNSVIGRINRLRGKGLIPPAEKVIGVKREPKVPVAEEAAVEEVLKEAVGDGIVRPTKVLDFVSNVVRLPSSGQKLAAAVRRAEKPNPKATPSDLDKIRESFVLDEAKACTINELNSTTCRWPLGGVNDPPPYMYCGCQKLDSSPWCIHHFDMAHSRGHQQQSRREFKPFFRAKS